TCKSLKSTIGVIWAAAVILWINGAMAAVVTSLADDGSPGTFRYAIDHSLSDNDITFAQGLSGTIYLHFGELLITNAVTITGPGANVLAISGHFDRVLTATTNAIAVISGLTLRDGSTYGEMEGGGGGVLNAGRLVLNQCCVTHCIVFSQDTDGVAA